nr:zinc ribbon domain-containing protein [Clostridium sp. 1001271st1 H5]
MGKPYEKIQWCCYQHIKDSKKCSQKAVREDLIQAAFVRLWNRLSSNYEEILIPMLAALKAIQTNPEQEREIEQIENQIQGIKMQKSYAE